MSDAIQADEPVGVPKDHGTIIEMLKNITLPVVGTLFVARGGATARAYAGLGDGPDEHSDLVRVSDVTKALEPILSALVSPPAAPVVAVPASIRNFLGKVQGVCMGVAMSGRAHPNPDSVLMELAQEAQELLFPSTPTETGEDDRQKADWDAWQHFLTELETWCCELPDRTSPDEAPEMMLLDRYELHMLADKVRAFLKAPAPRNPALSLAHRFKLRDSDFGRYIAPVMPFGCDMIVVFANPAGHLPVWLGLPHQLYIKTARDLLEKHGSTHLTIVPYRNMDKFDIEREALDAAPKAEAATDV
ncbi:MULTISPECIES: hypothetical protein [unclassified Ensifer]|uniref:hypothetical protein n=1 Tax=unclassified Ensifer TaxID=2633371 RepID=UPI0030100650